MWKRTAALTAVLLLTLTGCAGTPDDAASESEHASESAEPLVAETPRAVVTDDAEAAFLEDVRDSLPANTLIPDATDEQLLAAGWEACDRRASEPVGEDISLIEGEERNEGGIYRDSLVIVGAAWGELCLAD